jgi:hypothetical protein
LSLDVKLQPALEVSPTALRRADDIFQNEQEMILKAAQNSVKQKKPQLYIDDNGWVARWGVLLETLTRHSTDSSLRVVHLAQIPSSIALQHKPHH